MENNSLKLPDYAQGAIADDAVPSGAIETWDDKPESGPIGATIKMPSYMPEDLIEEAIPLSPEVADRLVRKVEIDPITTVGPWDVDGAANMARSIGAFFAQEPAQVIDIYKGIYRDAVFKQADNGRIKMTTGDGESFYLPDPTSLTGPQAATVIATSIPFGIAGNMAKTAFGRILSGMALSAGHSIGMDLIASAAGSRQGVSPERAAMGAVMDPIGAGIANLGGRAVRRVGRTSKAMYRSVFGGQARTDLSKAMASELKEVAEDVVETANRERIPMTLLNVSEGRDVAAELAELVANEPATRRQFLAIAREQNEALYESLKRLQHSVARKRAVSRASADLQATAEGKLKHIRKSAVESAQGDFDRAFAESSQVDIKGVFDKIAELDEFGVDGGKIRSTLGKVRGLLSKERQSRLESKIAKLKRGVKKKQDADVQSAIDKAQSELYGMQIADARRAARGASDPDVRRKYKLKERILSGRREKLGINVKRAKEYTVMDDEALDLLNSIGITSGTFEALGGSIDPTKMRLAMMQTDLKKLHGAWLELGDMLDTASIAKPMGRTTKKFLTDIKNELGTAMENASPKYKAAMEKYKLAMSPYNDIVENTVLGKVAALDPVDVGNASSIIFSELRSGDVELFRQSMKTIREWDPDLADAVVGREIRNRIAALEKFSSATDYAGTTVPNIPAKVGMELFGSDVKAEAFIEALTPNARENMMAFNKMLQHLARRPASIEARSASQLGGGFSEFIGSRPGYVSVAMMNPIAGAGLAPALGVQKLSKRQMGIIAEVLTDKKWESAMKRIRARSKLEDNALAAGSLFARGIAQLMRSRAEAESKVDLRTRAALRDLDLKSL